MNWEDHGHLLHTAVMYIMAHERLVIADLYLMGLALFSMC